MSHTQAFICITDLPEASGSAWGDYDNDSDVDFYVTNAGGPNHLYRNEGDTNGDGLPDFVDVAVALGVDDPDRVSHACIFIDYDNDGDQDLYVTNWGGNTLYRNQLSEDGAVSFVDVTAAAGVADAGRAVTSAWGDFDQDGYLDFYLAKHFYCEELHISDDRLYRNNGDGTFANVSGWLCPGGSAPCPRLEGAAFSASWTDYDNDGDPDLYVANEFPKGPQPNILWRNDGSDGQGGWTFTDVSAPSGADIDPHSMGLGVADYDNDGWFEFAVSNTGPNYLIRNLGNGTFQDVSASAGIRRAWIIQDSIRSVTWGTVFFDYDNDMLQDLYFVAGTIGAGTVPQPNVMFRNDGDGTFTDVSAATGLDDPRRGRCASIVDLDNDGFVDVFVGNLYQPPVLYHNQGATQGNQNNWLTVTVEGTVSNRDGIGTRLSLTTSDGVTQHREISSGPTYGGGDYRAGFFGLGMHTQGELVVRWPSGVEENIGTVQANQRLHLVEPDTGTAGFVTRINTGGAQYTDLSGKTFLADQPYSPGSAGYVGGRARVFSGDVQGTSDDSLYLSVRFSKTSFSYVVDDLPPGDYDVTLHFMEPVTNRVGGRLFDVFVEGSLVFDNLDIRAESGGILTALTKALTVPVTDGQIVIDFTGAGVRQPIVSAIEVAQTGDHSAGKRDVAGNMHTEQTPGTTLGLTSYPNPFNPATTIRYSLAEQGRVRLRVFNVLGQEIASLVDDIRAAGDYETSWTGTTDHGAAVPSGVYFLSLEALGKMETRSVVYMK
jgi:hypothetical protein